MKTLIVEKQALKNNIELIKKKASGTVVYAFLAADAGGMGLTEAAGFLRENGITHFAVTEAEDVARLRKSGLEQEEILMLRSTTDQEELERLLEQGAVCTVASYDSAVALNGIAEARGTAAECHVKIDVGTGGGGFLPSEPDQILSVFRYMPNLAVTGMYTRLRSANSSNTLLEAQMSLFQGAVSLVRSEGFDPGLLHAADSYSLLHCDPALRLDAVRVGSAFWGRKPGGKRSRLQKTSHLETAIDEVGWFPAGHLIVGGKPVHLHKAARLASIPVGAVDGLRAEPLWKRIFCRSAVSGWIRVGTERVRLIGHPGWLESLIDVTDVECTPGTVVTLDADPLLVRDAPRSYR